MNNSQMTAVAGELFVCAELTNRGWPASLTPQNTARIDVLAQLGDEALPSAIQVKTKKSGDFHVGASTRFSRRFANEWAILVALRDDAKPDYYVMPYDVFFAHVSALEVAIPGNKRALLGEQEFSESVYLNAWNLLDSPSWEAPWDMLKWVRDAMATDTWPAERGTMPDIRVRT